jgi:hypothetical protein
MRRAALDAWQPPEELMRAGLDRSRVVIMNEAHDGLRRCRRTREVGTRVLPVAHEKGVRDLAMEALWHGEFTDRANLERTLPPPHHPDSYLAQPEMRALIQAALDLGWTLHAYEADHSRAPAGLVTSVRQGESPSRISIEGVNWREAEQAGNLAAILAALGAEAHLLVWCGNGHGSKGAGGRWRPMGLRFQEMTGIDPFSIDQTVTVDWRGDGSREPDHNTRAELERLGGTAGHLVDGPTHDAVLHSLANRLE